MFSRFQTKLSVVFVALFIVVEAMILGIFYSTTYNQVESRLFSDLGISARVFDRIIGDKARQTWETSEFLSFDDRLGTAFRSSQDRELEKLLAQAGRKYAFSAAAILSGRGEVVAVYGTPGAEQWTDLGRQVMEASVDYERQVLIGRLSGRLYLLGFMPFGAKEQKGRVVIARELDEIAALESRALSSADMDIAFLYRANSEDYWTVTGATQNEFALFDFLSKNKVNFFAPEPLKVGRENYAVWRIPLAGIEKNGEYAALLFHSFEGALAPFRTTALGLGAIVLLGLLILVLGSHFLAQGVARPITALAGIAVKVSEGNYQDLQKIKDISDKGEVGRLARGFERMITAVQQRENQILYQASHDLATGLSNQVGLERHLENILKKTDRFNLVLIQIHNLGTLRGTLDPTRLVALLRETARRLDVHSVCPIAYISGGAFVLTRLDSLSLDLWILGILKDFEHPVDAAEVAVDVRLQIGG